VAPLRWWQRAAGDGVRRSWLVRALVHLRQQIAFHEVPPREGGGSLLDVGCGGGAFLDTMKQLGWRTCGVDPSPRAVDVARIKGHDVRLASAEDLPFAGGRFDLVQLNHVLEHTHSPRRALENARRELRPGGRLVLAVPNIGGVQARLFGRYWSGLDVPRHLYQFDARSLRRCLAEVGFRVLSLRTRTGATSLPKTLRLMINDLFGARWRRDQAWLVAPFEIVALLSSLVRNFGAGRDLRVVCRRT
jgi:2-polyprenyl-3-methyl-5-hydroxy-6-metoxy-1,4-benzoquinol methylase